MFSGKKVNKAGEKLLALDISTRDEEFSECIEILSYWRSAHEEPLEVAFSKLQQISKNHDSQSVYAKRLKRYISIISKLRRFNSMKLRGMQDIGGCRVIVKNEKKLRRIVRDLKQLPEIKAQPGRYRSKDYIKKPKEDGYRSYHLIGQFPDKNNIKKNIEIQLRTQMQHYWATAVEIVDIFTGQALKSSLGNEEWKDFFSLMSKNIAQMESIPSFENMTLTGKYIALQNKVSSNRDLLDTCAEAQLLSETLSVKKKFLAFATSIKFADDQLSESSRTGFVLIEIDTKSATVSAKIFDKEDNSSATDEYAKKEKIAAKRTGKIVALVSSSEVSGIPKAYPNFFADSTEFMHLVLLVNQIKNPDQKTLFERLIINS